MSQRMLLVGLVLALLRTTAAGAQSNITPPLTKGACP
jgi:hypothetical protein